MSHPEVSVVLPVLDEADSIDECLGSLAAQDYPGVLEIVVADGGSTDGTRERLAVWGERLPGLRVIDNEHRRQSAGLNLAVRSARGEVVVRADGHTTYASDYVSRSVELLLASDAVAVGGPLRPSGRTAFGRAVAAAMTARFGIGPGRFHHDDRSGPTDTVYLGAFRRADVLALGGYRTLPSGVAEDADLYFRWRRAGRVVVLDPSIRSTYRPRETVRALARQQLRYGRGKAEMLYLNRRLPSWRPLAPLGLVAGLAATGALAATTGIIWPLVALLAAWSAAVAWVALTRGGTVGGALRVAVAVAVMHLAYGAGLFAGLLRGPGPVRGLRRGVYATTPRPPRG